MGYDLAAFKGNQEYLSALQRGADEPAGSIRIYFVFSSLLLCALCVFAVLEGSSFAVTPKIAAGWDHTVMVKADGSLWAWGWNQSGQLGDGSPTNRLPAFDNFVPVRIGPENSWTSIATGYFHTVALKSDGSLWAWGNNQYGSLGDGTTTNRLTPVRIGTDTDWISVAAGYDYTTALKSDGTVWSWGHNNFGQLGDGTTTDRLAPVRIGIDNRWRAIASGDVHTVALKSDGTLWSWGCFTDTRLGDSKTTGSLTPVRASVPLGSGRSDRIFHYS